MTSKFDPALTVKFASAVLASPSASWSKLSKNSAWALPAANAAPPRVVIAGAAQTAPVPTATAVSMVRRDIPARTASEDSVTVSAEWSVMGAPSEVGAVAVPRRPGQSPSSDVRPPTTIAVSLHSA